MLRATRVEPGQAGQLTTECSASEVALTEKRRSTTQLLGLSDLATVVAAMSATFGVKATLRTISGLHERGDASSKQMAALVERHVAKEH